MGRRQRLISKSILRAIFVTKSSEEAPRARSGLLARIIAFFAIFQLALKRYRDALFKNLRKSTWHMDEEEYIESFRSPSKGKRTDLKSVGDLGYSGSVRSLQRQSELQLTKADVLHDTKLQIPHQVVASTFRTVLLPPAPP